ncbi:Clp protease N-terminal domain-containing protein [Streptosporangium sp. NPDC048865]|uniref:Clp protease N-terminal domain-containing protein n=1 Tax=Streptosporangium sp. NPDC048865 TaxID=3155766 RepID=UPI00342488F0
MFARFTPEARRTAVRAGLLSLDHGRTTLDEDMFLLALAGSWPVTGSPEIVGPGAAGSGRVTPETVGAEIRAREAARGRAGDRELLAAIGVDLDEIRRRLPARREDPLAWRLTRSRLRPLNVTLSGPAGDLLLTARARKVVEVALHASSTGPGSRVTDEDLLKGLLADASNVSVAILRRLGVDLRDLAASIGFLRESA